MNIKEFRASDLDVMQRLVGLKLKKFFKQLDFYIFVFGDETEYTLHTYCTFKVRKDNRICLRLRMKIIIQIANLCRSKFTKKTRCILKVC